MDMDFAHVGVSTALSLSLSLSFSADRSDAIAPALEEGDLAPVFPKGQSADSGRGSGAGLSKTLPKSYVMRTFIGRELARVAPND
jgi:hypothetical protein